MILRLGAIALILLTASPASALHLPEWMRFGSHASVDPGPPRPVVTEIVMDQGSDARSVPGVIVSRTEVTMAFQTLGRMIARHVDLGDRVEKGQLLAELSTDDLVASTRAARAAVDSAEVQLETARTTLQRTEALARRDVASDSQLEQAQQALAAAEANAEQTRSQLIQAQDTEGYARMTAPFSGVISAVYEASGAVVSAGAPVMQLSADDTHEAAIDLPEGALAVLPDDPAFTVWQRQNPGHEVTATIDRIEPLADIATRTRRLYLTLPPDAPFRLGALIRARLGAAGEPALTLPDAAILMRDGQSHVWRVTRDGDSATVELVPVRTRPSFEGRCLILDGLSEGDEIVVRGVHHLQPGQQVGRRVDP
ncbi:efflux RND transporter periplasmic adaptor subunit [Paracoccus homiensis]|uniref:efflux RND transporter periplasmic adaptor subunit n=1 Tax=Paracoccus homiensis TaxID=364199 RepID=UPI00398CA017